MIDEFDAKVAFITGAATGMGRAFAQALCSRGARVVVADIDKDGAERSADQLDPAGQVAVASRCDVADEQSVEGAIGKGIERFGGIDLLINNAARHLTEYTQPFSALPYEKIRELLDVNVMGVINCSLACRDAMHQRGGGVILNMSSVGGYTSRGAYSVTKLVVRGLTVAFATELAPYGIRVNALAPILTPTDNARAAYPPEHFENTAKTRQLIDRPCSIDDMVKAMLFLCSSDSSFITGETLRVSGGGNLSIG